MKLHLVFNAPVLLWEWFFELDDDLGLGGWMLCLGPICIWWGEDRD